MVRKGKNCYYCEECEMGFYDEKKACECEQYCKRYKACNIEIIKFAIKNKEVK